MAERARGRSAVDVAGLSAARRRTILRERALRLAGRGESDAGVVSGERVLLCGVGANLYGLPVTDVSKVKPLRRWGAAKGHDALIGLVSDEGEILPVLDLARLLGAPPSAPAPGGWLIRLSPAHAAALRVDELPATVEVERLDEGRGSVLAGEHADKLLVLLRPAELLALSPPTSQPHGAAAP